MALPVVMFEPIDMVAGLVLQFFNPPSLPMGQPSIGPGNFLQAMNSALFLFEKPDFGTGQLACFDAMPDSKFLVFGSLVKNSG